MTSKPIPPGAPRVGDRYVNPNGATAHVPLRMALGFFVRRIWGSVVPRAGGAPRVDYDPVAIMHEPGITWIGHSTFLVRTDGVTFLTDPMFAKRASPFSFMGPARAVPPGIPFEDVPPVDFVLLSHDHYDHADIATVKRLARGGVRFIVPLGMRAWVERAGGQAAELDWWQSITVGDVRIDCVPAQHFSGRSFRDRGLRLWAGWVVSGPTRRFYYAGDTAYTPDLATIGERLGPFDLAAVPIGAYRPAEIMRPVHTTPEEAVRVMEEVRAAKGVAMHYGTFDLADEPLDEPPARFRAEARRLGWLEDRAWVMKVGETRRW